MLFTISTLLTSTKWHLPNHWFGAKQIHEMVWQWCWYRWSSRRSFTTSYTIKKLRGGSSPYTNHTKSSLEISIWCWDFGWDGVLEIVASGGRNYNCGSRCWFEAVFGIRQPKQIARCAACVFGKVKRENEMSPDFYTRASHERAPTHTFPLLVPITPSI